MVKLYNWQFFNSKLAIALVTIIIMLTATDTLSLCAPDNKVTSVIVFSKWILAIILALYYYYLCVYITTHCLHQTTCNKVVT